MLALAAALIPLLAACNPWEQVGYGPDNGRFNPTEAAITPGNVGSLHEAWSSHVDGNLSEPILSGDRLYTTVASTGSGSVRAYDVRTGAIAWETPVPAPRGPRPPSPVVLVGGALWVTHEDSSGSLCSAQLTRLDPATGNVLGTETTGPRAPGPVVADGTTMAFTTDGRCSQTGNQPQLVVRDVGDPAQGWTFRFPAGVFPTSPSIGDGRIFVVADDVAYAFDAAGCGAPTCSPVWTASLDVDDTNVTLVEDRPVVGPDGTVYIGAATIDTETVVLALDGATGAHLWRTDRHPGPGSSWQSLALAHGQLYVSDHRFDGGGGAVEVFPAGGCGQPVCGEPTWSASVDGPPVAGLTVGGEVLYLGLFRQGDSRFVAFDAGGCGTTTCPRLANVAFGNEQPVQAAVADGRVAVVGAGSTGQTLRVLVPN